MSQKQGAASSTPNRARSDTKSALEASPHVSTKTTPHVSSPLIPKSTPSSARKSKRKTIEEDLVPERPHGEHIFSLDQKDVNLATLSCPSVFGMAAAWMRNDPCGEHSTTRTSRSALAGLTLPEPAAAQHSPRPTKHPRGIHRHASSVELRLDAGGVGVVDVCTRLGTHSIVWTVCGVCVECVWCELVCVCVGVSWCECVSAGWCWCVCALRTRKLEGLNV
eukprot:m.569462 g.569462  ORF g.569462 m.569462 type:complete len:221 (-) comp22260_c0_seq10:299-961(-)